MTDIIIALVFFSLIGAVVLGIYRTLKNRKERYLKPNNEQEWHEIKFGAGFVLLNWEEKKLWDGLSISDKSKVAHFQQDSLKHGRSKIVVVDGQKRLVTISNFKQVKSEQGKSKN